MSEPSLTDCQSDTESLEEEIEPKLKYIRLTNDLQSILLKDAASCIAVHPKFICLGSHWGVIHLLDHQGNSIEGKELRAHTVAVNQISIDTKGDYLATCSDDGKIFIHGLYSLDNNQNLNVGRLVKTIALDPNYFKSGSGRRFITGDDKLTLFEKTIFARRSTVLCESEGLVRSLCWGENFIAWASDIGVRVYDINARCSLGLIKWEEHPGISIDKFRCNLRWADSRTLLIGWVDTVRVCVIRKRSTIELANRDLPEYLVDPVSTFQTEFYISGIAPLEQQLVLLGFPKELDEDNKSLRPQLYIVEYRDNDYTDICMDSLSLRGYKEYNVNDYHLDVLLEEHRFFIVAPKDIVIASPYDLDDRIQWLIQHSKYEEALDAISKHGNRENRKFTIENVGIAYLDYLLSRNLYERAGKLCHKIFGRNKLLWEEEIFKFATVHQLRSVSAYIPRSLDCKLNKHIYEMVLYEYLKMDSQGFLNLVKEWSSQLYNTSAVINAVLEHLLICETSKNIYLEALALLYSYEKKYDKSLSMYLKLKHKDVFSLIQKHNLYNVIHDMIVELMDLDYEKAIALFLDKNRIEPEVVVQKLSNHQALLYRYLDAYDKIDSKKQYHGMLVKLYAIFDRDKLLPLLRRSDHYPIQQALDICEKEKYYPEMVFLLARIGDTKEALQLITEELKDMQYAITFCQEQNDPDLWKDLINHSLDKPEFITFLLQSLGTYMDPTELVRKIKSDMEIPGLKHSLVKMLCIYNLQPIRISMIANHFQGFHIKTLKMMSNHRNSNRLKENNNCENNFNNKINNIKFFHTVSVQEGCKKNLVSDYFNLHKKLVKIQQKGMKISDEMVCGACHRKIVVKDVSRNSVIIYNCKHSFHELCLPDTSEITNCGICHETTTNYRISSSD